MLSFDELRKNFKDKKVLITGHTGFKGSYLVVLLKYLGAKVYGYALKEEKDSLYYIIKNQTAKETVFLDIDIEDSKTNVKKSPEIKKGQLVDDEVYADIRDLDKLKKFIKKTKPDYIIHMAAQPLVLEGYENPHYTYEVNVMGTVSVLEALKDYTKSYPNKKISFLNVTTDKVYENNDLSNYAFKEEDKLCGRDPYANSKSCSELVTYAYNKSFFSDNKNVFISTARAGNVIGGGDLNKNRIIPDCYKAIKSHKKVVIRNPQSIRPYQYVLEPLVIYLNIMAMQLNNKKYEGSYNIGPDKKDCLKTKDLVEKFFDSYENLCNKTKSRPDKVSKNNAKSKAHEATFLRLDNKLIKQKLKYKEIFTMKETMNATAIVYDDMLNKKNVLQSIVNIISEYLDK